jgi:hypothetical protein
VSGTLYAVFVVAAIICVIAGVAAVTRTRRRVRDNEYDSGEDDGGMTYAEESAAVANAEAALEAQQGADDERDGLEGAPPA